VNQCEYLRRGKDCTFSAVVVGIIAKHCPFYRSLSLQFRQHLQAPSISSYNFPPQRTHLPSANRFSSSSTDPLRRYARWYSHLSRPGTTGRGQCQHNPFDLWSAREVAFTLYNPRTVIAALTAGNMDIISIIDVAEPSTHDSPLSLNIQSSFLPQFLTHLPLLVFYMGHIKKTLEVVSSSQPHAYRDIRHDFE